MRRSADRVAALHIHYRVARASMRVLPCGIRCHVRSLAMTVLVN